MIRQNVEAVEAGQESRFKVNSYNFRDHKAGKAKYWKDVGTMTSFWEANMDLKNMHPLLNLYKRDDYLVDERGWPIRGSKDPYNPPPKLVGDLRLINSLVTEGCILSNCLLAESLFFPCVIVGDGTHVINSVILNKCKVGSNCVLQNVIMDKYCVIGDGISIGFNKEQDIERGLHVVGDLTIVAKGTRLGKTCNGFPIEHVIP
jgi:glucose-1-phosphate adenylyltransferase